VTSAYLLQCDTYRAMRDAAEADWPEDHPSLTAWEHFTPRTNTIWIVYLVDMLRLASFKNVCKVSADKAALTRFRCGFILPDDSANAHALGLQSSRPTVPVQAVQAVL
jgi:Haspin like kinase domain